MSLPIEDLTPKQIVGELDKYIIGQDAAKKAVAVALRNRWRRQQLAPSDREDILPKNILMIGPTGVGKTEIARRLAQLARAPFIKVEATKFTEVGYVGRDVESIIRDLVASAVRLVEQERVEQIRPQAEERTLEKLANLLDPAFEAPEETNEEFTPANIFQRAYEIFGSKMDDGYPDEPVEPEQPLDPAEEQRKRKRRRARLLKRLRSGELDNEPVEIEVEESTNPFVQVFSPQGMEEMGLDIGNVMSPFPSRKTTRSLTVAEAREVLFQQEAQRMIDRQSVHREAIQRTEQTGIVFLDEIDKVAAKSGGAGPDVSREGVQRDLLPIIEGSTVQTKFGPVRTDHTLFICAGAFHMSKPSDLIPELQGRLPIRVELESLTESDFQRILREPKNALTKQYQKLLEADGVSLAFDDAALDEIAKMATEVNNRVENIGARRLHTLLEKLLEEPLFDAPDTKEKKVHVTPEFVRQRLASLIQDVDLSRYIL